MFKTVFIMFITTPKSIGNTRFSTFSSNKLTKLRKILNIQFVKVV